MDRAAGDSSGSAVALEALLLRLILLHETAVGYSGRGFAEVLQQAQERVPWVFAEARLHLLPPEEAQNLPGRGRVGEKGYGTYFPGPPQPRYLLLEYPGLTGPTELRLTALFMDYLLSALQAAGYREELERQARHDWMTGLGNRWSLERRLDLGVPPGWGIALLDLDNLKVVNDTQGHLAGDRLLKGVASALMQAGFDAYRIGGDEFVVLLQRNALDRLLQVTQEYTLSVGLAWAEEGETWALYELADRRMYAQKRLRKAVVQMPPA